MIRVGIPRALLYYQYYPMWQTFFEKLDAAVVVSPPTTQAMLNEGASRVVADTCLPVKVFLGHVLSLVGKCDRIFVPAIRSVRNRVYNCSKFLGLPDMTRAVIPEAPPILEIEIDVSRGKRKLYQGIYQLGRQFTWNPLRVRQVSLAAWKTYLDYRRLMPRQQWTPPQALARLSGDKAPPARLASSSAGQIAVIGHPYLLYDEHITHRLVHRLECAGYKVVTPEMLTTGELDTAVVQLASRAYWTYEEEVVGAGGYYLQSDINGIIGIMAFGCGPDSVMMDAVRRQAARLGTVPFMCLTLEEHTAEAGVVTRLEAFTDMLRRNKRRRVEVCV